MVPPLLLLVLVLVAEGSAGRLPADALTDADAHADALARTRARRAVAAASNVFGVDLHEVLSRGSGGNLVTSPLSAAAALGLVLQGARGRTAQQVARALHLSDDAREAALGFEALLAPLTRPPTPTPTQGGAGAAEEREAQVVLRAAHVAFAAEAFGVKEGFRRAAARAFGAETRALDFARRNEAARAAVNAWAARATNGLVPELYAPDTLDPETLLLLVNAIYFKGNWATPFKEENTKDRPFHLSSTEQVNVPTMRDIVRAETADLPQFNATVLRLLYNDQETKLLIFMPDEADGLQQLENNLRLISLDEISFDPIVMEVQLPKFKITTNLRLKPALQKLGVEDLFSTEKANLTGVSDLKGLCASKVLHSAVIEVNEKGTEAAAATSVELANKFVPDFRVNRPFIFMLVDADQTVLFLGRVTNPLE